MSGCRCVMAKVAVLVVIPSYPTVARAQDAQSQLTVTAGVATDQRGVRSSAVSAIPSFTLGGSSASLSVNGSATRFASESWTLGGGASFAARTTSRGPLTLTLNASGGVAWLGGAQTGRFSSGELLPAAELRVRRVTLFGGARVAAGASSLDEPRSSLPLGGGRTQAVSTSRTGAGPTYGMVLDFSSSAGVSTQLNAREDRLTVDHVAIVDRSVTLSISGAAAAFAASAGRRSASDEHLAFGSVAVSVPLNESLALSIAGGRYASNRLSGTPGGRFLTGGVTLRVGTRRAATLPEATGVRRARSGFTRLSIDAPDARRVELLGDFNEWTPIVARRAANGVWYADVSLPPGEYRYAFRIDGSEWRVPQGATVVSDGFGGKSALIVVRGDRAK